MGEKLTECVADEKRSEEKGEQGSRDEKEGKGYLPCQTKNALDFQGCRPEDGAERVEGDSCETVCSEIRDGT